MRPAITGQNVDPARVEFPLDYDRRHSLTVIGQIRLPDTAGPVLRGWRVAGGIEGAAIVRFTSGSISSRLLSVFFFFGAE